MRRIMLFDRFDQPIGELSENEVFAATRPERVNGEHCMRLTTTRVLEQGWRVLTCDDRGKWREHVVYGTDSLHDSGERAFGDYYCVWSLQADLMGTRVSRMPGVQTPVSASVALGYAIEGTSRWAKGTVTNTNTGGGSMYDMDGWSAMSVLIANWGGEIDATIEVGSTGVMARKVDYYSVQGDQDAKRRYDFGSDLKSVRRTVADGPLYCRITPRGAGEESGDGYGRKITIESVNGGKDYLENQSMVDLAKLPDGSGGWEYPTLEVENSECTTPADLKSWGESVLEESTVPKITYQVDVLQLAKEGVDMHGVSLGDAVHVVDRKFGDGLRISGRVLEMTVNLLDESDVQLVVGSLSDDLASMFGSLNARLTAVTNTVQAMNGGTMSTAEYLSRLLERINAEVNATGGYTYITEGQGIRTYDVAVSDPLVGSEASAVVEIKGGTIRIANSKTAQGDWEWKTVFTSGHIAADLVTAVNVTAGRIESANGESYWDLDSNQFVTRNADLTGKVTATSGIIGGMTIENTQLSNDFMILRDNALLFKARNATRTVSGIVGVKGEGSASGVYGAVFGSFESASYGQFIGLNYNLAEGNPPDTGLPFLAYTTRNILLYNKYYYANRLNFPVDLEILDDAEIYLPYKSSGVIYHDKGLTQNVAVGNTLLKFRKGLLVGTGSA